MNTDRVHLPIEGPETVHVEGAEERDGSEGAKGKRYLVLFTEYISFLNLIESLLA